MASKPSPQGTDLPPAMQTQLPQYFAQDGATPKAHAAALAPVDESTPNEPPPALRTQTPEFWDKYEGAAGVTPPLPAPVLLPQAPPQHAQGPSARAPEESYIRGPGVTQTAPGGLRMARKPSPWSSAAPVPADEKAGEKSHRDFLKNSADFVTSEI